MAEKDKKYYWLKLKKDFFKRQDIQIVESMPNGKDYVLFYLKLLLESIDREGELRFNDTIPYNLEMLSTITNTNIDIVRSAIKIFEQLKFIELWDDGTYFVTQVNEMLGHETYWAKKKRKQREQQKQLDNVQQLSNGSPTCPSKSIELEKELELDIEKDIDIKKEDNTNVNKIDYEGFVEKFHNICNSLPKIRKLTKSRRDNIKRRLKDYEESELLEAFKLVEASDFLTGRSSDFKASFDWVLKPSNLVKILEGNYKNKVSNKTRGVKRTVEAPEWVTNRTDVKPKKYEDNEDDQELESLYQQALK